MKNVSNVPLRVIHSSNYLQQTSDMAVTEPVWGHSFPPIENPFRMRWAPRILQRRQSFLIRAKSPWSFFFFFFSPPDGLRSLCIIYSHPLSNWHSRKHYIASSLWKYHQLNLTSGWERGEKRHAVPTATKSGLLAWQPIVVPDCHIRSLSFSLSMAP